MAGAPESYNTTNGFEFKKQVLVIVLQEVAVSFLRIAYIPTLVGLGGGGT